MKILDFNKIEYVVIERDVDKEEKTLTMVVVETNFQWNISTNFIMLIYFHQATEKLIFISKDKPLSWV